MGYTVLPYGVQIGGLDNTGTLSSGTAGDARAVAIMDIASDIPTTSQFTDLVGSGKNYAGLWSQADGLHWSYGTTEYLLTSASTSSLQNAYDNGSTITGTPVITGNISLTGFPLYTSPQTLTSGSGAVNVTATVTLLPMAASTGALTIAAGTSGQVKYITAISRTGSATSVLSSSSSPLYLSSGGTLTFNGLGQGAVLYYDGSKWAILSTNGTIA